MKTLENFEIIRSFIIDRGKATKNEVVKHMDGRSSRVTTFEMIDELESNGVIKIVQGDRRGLPHYLMINYEGDMNIIIEQLTDTLNVLNQFDKPIRKISERYGRFGHSKANDFKNEYREFLRWTFEILLIRTAHVIQSERDTQALFRKIVELMLKLNDQFTMVDNENYTDSIASMFLDDLHPGVKKFGINENSVNDLRKLVDGINNIVTDEAQEARNKAYEQRRRQMQMPSFEDY